MANLDKLLRKIEKNAEIGNEPERTEYKIAGETFEVRKLTRKEKSELMYSLEVGKSPKAGDLVKMMIKPIYNCFNLKDLAVKAKDAGHIKSYYDVVEMLFEPEEIFEIIGYIFEINNLANIQSLEAVEDLKK